VNECEGCAHERCPSTFIKPANASWIKFNFALPGARSVIFILGAALNRLRVLCLTAITAASGASPKESGFKPPETNTMLNEMYAAASEACARCARECEFYASEFAGSIGNTVRLCLDCAQLCRTTAAN